jgi:hypothetical protein
MFKSYGTSAVEKIIKFIGNKSLLVSLLIQAIVNSSLHDNSSIMIRAGVEAEKHSQTKSFIGSQVRPSGSG